MKKSAIYRETAQFTSKTKVIGNICAITHYLFPFERTVLELLRYHNFNQGSNK